MSTHTSAIPNETVCDFSAGAISTLPHLVLPADIEGCPAGDWTLAGPQVSVLKMPLTLPTGVLLIRAAGMRAFAVLVSSQSSWVVVGKGFIYRYPRLITQFLATFLF